METILVRKIEEGYTIIVQHEETGSAYGIDLSEDAYHQLRQHFISSSLPFDNEVINNCPQSSLGTREVWMRGAVWMKEYILKGNP